jgi:hypothetical protein
VISTTSRHQPTSSFFFLQGKAPKEIQAILTETLREHAPLSATVKNWVAQYNLLKPTAYAMHQQV